MTIGTLVVDGHLITFGTSMESLCTDAGGDWKDMQSEKILQQKILKVYLHSPRLTLSM